MGQINKRCYLFIENGPEFPKLKPSNSIKDVIGVGFLEALTLTRWWIVETGTVVG